METLKLNLLFRICFALIIFVAIDLYAFQSFRFVTRNLIRKAIRSIYIFYWALSGFCYALIILAQLTDWHNWNNYLSVYGFSVLVIMLIFKVILIVFVLIDDIIRFFRLGLKIISGWVFKSGNSFTKNKGTPISRSEFINRTGLFVASVPFFSMIHGMVFNAYNYRVRKVYITLPALPEPFERFRMVQISDIHTGSFTGTRHLARAVDLINEQMADITFFTGDLVNFRAAETTDFIDTLRKLESKYGTISIFGNHDYGDYYQWESPEGRQNNIIELKEVHRRLGWDLLWDDYRRIEKGGETISIIGSRIAEDMVFQTMEIWGKATEGLDYSPVNILLTHDPSHWRREVIPKYPKIDLTLSGHTHGMQFGVDLPGFRWSPVQYLYKEWADLYRENNQYLYVNRGLGFIGYPGRVGVLPEITVIELRKKEVPPALTTYFN